MKYYVGQRVRVIGKGNFPNDKGLLGTIICIASPLEYREDENYEDTELYPIYHVLYDTHTTYWHSGWEVNDKKFNWIMTEEDIEPTGEQLTFSFMKD